MRVFETQTQAIETSLSVNARTSESSEAFTVKKDPHEIKVTGKNQVSQNWYMILPDFQLKTKVHVLPDLKVIPGGQSIGVKLHSVGVLVVGFHQINTSEGKNLREKRQELKRATSLLR